MLEKIKKKKEVESLFTDTIHNLMRYDKYKDKEKREVYTQFSNIMYKLMHNHEDKGKTTYQMLIESVPTSSFDNQDDITWYYKDWPVSEEKEGEFISKAAERLGRYYIISFQHIYTKTGEKVSTANTQLTNEQLTNEQMEQIMEQTKNYKNNYATSLYEFLQAPDRETLDSLYNTIMNNLQSIIDVYSNAIGDQGEPSALNITEENPEEQ